MQPAFVCGHGHDVLPVITADLLKTLHYGLPACGKCGSQGSFKNIAADDRVPRLSRPISKLLIKAAELVESQTLHRARAKCMHPMNAVFRAGIGGQAWTRAGAQQRLMHCNGGMNFLNRSPVAVIDLLVAAAFWERPL